MHFLAKIFHSLLVVLMVLGSSVAHAADPDKVLRYVFTAAETGFDPAVAHDLYSSQVIRSVYETLYAYDYLARPARLVPSTAEALPVISNNGKTYTITLKKVFILRMILPSGTGNGN